MEFELADSMMNSNVVALAINNILEDRVWEGWEWLAWEARNGGKTPGRG